MSFGLRTVVNPYSPYINIINTSVVETAAVIIIIIVITYYPHQEKKYIDSAECTERERKELNPREKLTIRDSESVCFFSSSSKSG